MQPFRRTKNSINRRLTRTVFLVTVTTLVIASLAFIASDWLAIRGAIIRNTGTLAEVVGINSAVALAFYDPAAAAETLHSLSAVDTVEAAVIYDRTGEPFATYESRALRGSFTPPPVRQAGHEFGSGIFELAREIVFNGEGIGTIYIRTSTAEFGDRAQRNTSIVALLLLAVAFVTALISSHLRRQVAVPLADLANASAAIANGNLSIEVSVTTEDEIGALAKSFNAMTASLRDIVGRVLQNVGDVADVTKLLEESGRVMAEQSLRQSAAIFETTDSTRQLGDSIIEVDTNVSQLSDSARNTATSILEMNASIISVDQHMDHLGESIAATSAGVDQVANGNDRVVSGVETLKMATDDSVERLQDLRRSVQQVRQNASESHTLCDDTSLEAVKGMEAVNETIAAMNEISRSFGDLDQSVSRLADNAHSIGEILDVIRDVAEQTTMLSLNAAIIAAHAGEHGRAFAVVADEVSSLAARTQRSTREVAKLVQAVWDDTAAAVAAAEKGAATVETGVQRSNVAGKVLAKISGKSRDSTAMVHAIFEASAQQNTELERVEGSMFEVREIVGQISCTTLEQQQPTDEIARAVEKLRSMGEGVKISTDEQRRGSRLITDSASHVAAMIEEIAVSTRAQTKSSETIQQALQVFQDVAGETTRSAETLGTMVETLSERSRQLDAVVGRFKTE